MRLNARAFGFALGIIWGATIFVMTLLALWSQRSYGSHFLYNIASIYPGYLISLSGAFLGLCYGFIDGFIAGWLTAVLYNFFAREK